MGGDASARAVDCERHSHEGDRPAINLERMLRIYFLQEWFNLGDPTVEEALYDSRAMEAVRKNRFREPVPDETTICKFRHLLERHGLGPALLEEANAHWAENGLTIGRGTIADATIIAAPSSTKNATGKRDPKCTNDEGPRVAFGMKAHIGMDRKLKIVQSFAVTPANAHDSHLLPELLHGDETRVCGDAASAAADFTHHYSARRPGLSKRQ